NADTGSGQSRCAEDSSGHRAYRPIESGQCPRGHLSQSFCRTPYGSAADFRPDKSAAPRLNEAAWFSLINIGAHRMLIFRYITTVTALIFITLINGCANAQTAGSTTERNRQFIVQAFEQWAAGNGTFFQDVLSPD